MTSISGPIAASQLTVFKSLFSAADNNKDSVITKDEAESVRKKLPASAKIAGSDLAKAFSSLDLNRDNKLTASELAVLLAQQEATGGTAPTTPAPTTPAPTTPVTPAPTIPAPTTSTTPATPAMPVQSTSAADRLKLLTDVAVDKNKDGAFSKDELETVRKGLEKAISFAGSDLATLFTSADANNDKKLSAGEIKTFLALQSSEPPAPDKDTGTGAVVTGPPTTPGPIVTTPTPSTPSSGHTDAAIPSPFPVTGPYKTDKLGAINVWGMAGEPQSAEKPYSLNVSDGILRVEAHQGDRRQKSSEISRDIERAEVSFAANPFSFGKTYDVSFSMMFQGDAKSTADNDKFFQIHNTNDPGDASLGPIFAMQLEGDRMRIVTRSDPNATTTARVEDNWIYEDTKDIERNTWYDFDIKIRVDPFGQGMVTVSRNGEQIANYEGPLGYNDKQPPYAKIGVYRDSSPETQVRLYKDMAFTPLKS